MSAENGPIRTRGNGFVNPYAFVSIPDRESLPECLHDRSPAPHDRFDTGRWTGSIEVTLTTRTPLLIPDHSGQDSAEPLAVRRDSHDRPLLSGSAVKGMLRSAYEAITNSRFGVFPGHDQPLAIRAEARPELIERLRPAVVTGVDPVSGDVTLTWVSNLEPGSTPNPRRRTQPAVWVPQDLSPGPGVPMPRERRGCEVEAWIYHATWVKIDRRTKKRREFDIWRVAAYAKPGELGPCPSPPKSTPNMTVHNNLPLVQVRGRLHWTGSSFPAGGRGKHDERLVVEKILSGEVSFGEKSAVVESDLVQGWRAVIDSFVEAHESEFQRAQTDEERKGLQRRYGTYVTDPESWRQLKTGDTLFVEIEPDKRPRGNTEKTKKPEIVALHPAMIGRRPFPGAPALCLPENHHPATDRDRLSPADRVFGWVRQGEDDSGIAHRGHLRVLPPDGAGIPPADSIHRLPNGLVLTTLNGPKPAQFLFYLGDGAGKPLSGENSKKEPGKGYPAERGRSSRRLRGRKVYPTHAEVLAWAEEPEAEEYWTPPARSQPRPTPLTIKGRTRYREYIASGQVRESVATQISEWVRAGTTFTVTLQVDNLDDVELGALLWLLTLPKQAMLRLGLGKPLGFGAVRVDVEPNGTRLYQGHCLDQRYRGLGRSPEACDLDRALGLARDYDQTMRTHLRTVREEFLAAACGFEGSPVHYPRAGDSCGQPSPPHPETYDWWVANDRSGGRVALGELTDPESMCLPYHPSTTREKTGSGREKDRGKGRR